MKKSKYLGLKQGSWLCTKVNIAYRQGAYYKGTKTPVKSTPGTMTYSYDFERETSDDKADKLVKLSASEAAKVWRGDATVEEIAEKRRSKAKRLKATDRKVRYWFY